VSSPGAVEESTAISHEINSEFAKLKIASVAADRHTDTAESTLERPHHPPPVTG